MLKLTISGSAADLAPGASVTLNLANPAFDGDSTGRAYSFPFRLPASPANLAIFSHVTRMDARPGANKYPAVLETEVVRMEGWFWVTEVSEGEVEGHFGNEALEVMAKLGDLKINKILATVTIEQNDFAEWIFDPQTPFGQAFAYAVSINGKAYLKIVEPPFPSWIDTCASFQTDINADWPGMCALDANQLILTWQPADFDKYPAVLMGNHFDFVSARTVGQVISDSFRDFFTECLDTPPATHAFPVFLNAGLYGASNPLFFGMVNYAKKIGGDWFFASNLTQETKTWENTMIPFVRVGYVLQKLADEAGYSGYAGTWWDMVDADTLLIYSNRTLDEAHQDYTDAALPFEWFNHFVRSFDLNLFVPEMNGKDFLLALAGFFNFGISFRDNRLFLDKAVDGFFAEKTDWTEKVEPGYTMALQEAGGFRLAYPLEESDTATAAGQLEDYLVGEGKYAPEIRVGTLRDQDYNEFRVAFASQPGQVDALGLKQKIGLRILFDRGLSESSDGADYWLAQHENVDRLGNPSGDYSLEWDGDDGVYMNFWKTYIEAVANGQEVRIRVRMSASDMEAWKARRVRFTHPNGTVEGLVKSLRLRTNTTYTPQVVVEATILRI